MAALIFLVCVSSWGQTPLNQLSYSSDITAIFSSTLLQDEEAGEDDLAGSVGVVSLGLPLPTDLIALHRIAPTGGLFSTDTGLTLSGTIFIPGDVIQFDGANYSYRFNDQAVGLPAGANVDAVTVDGSDLLLSFDTTLLLSGNLVADEDLVRFNGASFSIEFDGSAAGVLEAQDLDGAHRLANDNLLLSFNGGGGGDGMVFGDEDVLEFVPGPATWTLA